LHIKNFTEKPEKYMYIDIEMAILYERHLKGNHPKPSLV
jgi:hypothetical protein